MCTCVCARACSDVWSTYTGASVCARSPACAVCACGLSVRVHACALSMDECAQRIRTRMLEHVCAHTRAHVCVGQDWGRHRPCSPGRPPGGGGALAGGWTAGAALGGWWHQAEASAPRGLPDDEGRAGPRARSPRLLCSPVPARAPAATRLGGGLCSLVLAGSAPGPPRLRSPRRSNGTGWASLASLSLRWPQPAGVPGPQSRPERCQAPPAPQASPDSHFLPPPHGPQSQHLVGVSSELGVGAQS